MTKAQTRRQNLESGFWVTSKGNTFDPKKPLRYLRNWIKHTSNPSIKQATK